MQALKTVILILDVLLILLFMSGSTKQEDKSGIIGLGIMTAIIAVNMCMILE